MPRNAVFWTYSGCSTHELTTAAVTCTRLGQIKILALVVGEMVHYLKEFILSSTC